MKRKICFFILLILCFLLVNFYAVNSDSLQKKKSRKDLQYEVTVTLKLVQVYVVDKKGNPVTDLEKSDFELYDNGKRQSITDFERHILPLPSTETRIIEERVEPNQPGTMSRKIFLFFDFAFNSPAGIDMAKKAALYFLDTQVNVTDEIGVVSYSTHKGLVLHEYLTDDYSKIRDVIHELGWKEALGRAGRLLEEQEGDVRRGEIAHRSEVGPEDPRKVAQETWMRIAGIEQLKHQVRDFSSAVKDWAVALRHIPGHKHIVLFSTGVPNFIIYPSSTNIAPQVNKMNIGLSDSTALRIRYEKMYKELAASNSPVFAVNVEGLYADIMEKEGESLQPSLGISSRDRRGANSLLEIANHSGGKYFGNINDYKKVVEEIQNITGSYYVLGYYINEKWDGKYHKIKTIVRRSGCKVYGQRGYFNPKLFKKYTDLEKKLHLVDLALSERPYFGEPLDFPLVALPYSLGGKPGVVILARLLAEKMKDVYGEKTEIIFLMFDERKNIVAYQRIEPNDPKFSQDDIICYAVSSFYPGKFDCRVIIRDLESGKGAVGSSSVVIHKTPDSGIKLYPPLLLVPEQNISYMNALAAKKKEGEEEHSTLLSVYPFDQTLYSPLVENLKKETQKLLVMGRCSIFNIPKAEVKFIARFVHQPFGKKIPLSFTSDDKLYGDDLVFSLELETGELEPGEYYLYFFAEEKNTQSKSQAHTTFIIK